MNHPTPWDRLKLTKWYWPILTILVIMHLSQSMSNHMLSNDKTSINMASAPCPGHQQLSFQFSQVPSTWLSPGHISMTKSAFTRDATGSATAARQPRRKNRNIGIQQERLHGDTQHAAEAWLLRARAAISVLTYNCCAAHAVASSCLSFLWRTPTPKTADTWIICRSRARQLPTM